MPTVSKTAVRYLFIAIVATYASTMVQATDTTTRIKEFRKKRKVIFIAGAPSHGKGEHEFKGGCTLLAKSLNENTSDINAVVYDSGWPADTTVLENAASIVIYCDGGERHLVLPHMAHMNRLMKKGIGLVLLHYAVEVPKGAPGDQFLKWAGGYFEPYWSVNPWWGPTFNTIPKHPVSRGVFPFSIKDEWYFHIRFTERMKNSTSLLADVPPRETLKSPDGSHDNNPYVREDLANGISQTMAWSFKRTGGGRSFGFTGGHMHNNWMHNDFRKFVLNGIVWTANGHIPAQGITSQTPTQSEMDALLFAAKE